MSAMDCGRRYPPIESHGVIGDLQTAALVGMDGCIDFLCLPFFDSPSVFASLLDSERGGRFSLEPLLDGVRRRQLYLPDTNVLLTRFLSPDGVAEISDYMPIHAAPHPSRIVRQVKAIRGETRFQMRCAPRFDYGRAEHRLEWIAGGALFTGADGHVLRLSTPVPLKQEGGDVVAEFTLASRVDGLAGTEGTFSICTFWYVEALSRAGAVDQARFRFEKMLGYANHLGLYSEELGKTGEHLGNFPQAFTHLALISAAYELDRRLSGRRGSGGARSAG